MAKKLCELCGVKPATVPDRNRPGRPINRVCSDCHAGRLAGDFQEVAKAAVPTTAEMTNKERDEQVDRLLHDAEHAEAGASFARSIGHYKPATNMSVKASALRRLALDLDPTHEAPAWAEDAEWQKRTPQ